ncbi:MAG: ABC transporter ATP-binding protein, partial [Pseudomonadota bacterium]|nr:ABC transporter ATP-binding protein [Pseudomonadota bacterium]
LMIARALIHEPKVLILDEPTAGVDIELRRSMWEFIKELNEQGTTIILTTHYLEEAEQLCRNIAIINSGEIVENTSVKALLKTLSSETFVLDLDRSLSSVELDGYEMNLVGDGSSIEVAVMKGQNLNDVFNYLNQLNVKVVSMRNKSNRLEELFVKLIKGSK